MCGGGSAGNDGNGGNFGDGLGPADNSQNNANNGNIGAGPGGSFGGPSGSGTPGDSLADAISNGLAGVVGTPGANPNNSAWGQADAIDLDSSLAPNPNNSSWGRGDAIDRGPEPLGSKAAIDAAYDAFSNMSFSDRVTFGGWGPAVRSAFSNVARGFMENPVQSIVNFAFNAIPFGNPILGGLQVANQLAGLVNGLAGTNVPTVGSMAQAGVRGDANLGLAEGSVSRGDPTGVPGGGAFDGGGSSAEGWNGVLAGLDAPLQPDTGGISTAPTTVSSLDQRVSYGFSPGQGVDYADLSDGFGGTNTGARGGWRGARTEGWA